MKRTMPLKEFKEYYDDGQLYVHYYIDENGALQGEYKDYYETGQLWTHSHWKNNNRHGKRIFYNEDGSVLSIQWYSHGEDVTELRGKILKWKSKSL